MQSASTWSSSPTFSMAAVMVTRLPKDRFASRPGSELKYLVLDAILRAQGLGQAIGVPVTQENRRYHALRDSKERCFND